MSTTTQPQTAAGKFAHGIIQYIVDPNNEPKWSQISKRAGFRVAQDFDRTVLKDVNSIASAQSKKRLGPLQTSYRLYQQLPQNAVESKDEFVKWIANGVAQSPQWSAMKQEILKSPELAHMKEEMRDEILQEVYRELRDAFAQIAQTWQIWPDEGMKRTQMLRF